MKKIITILIALAMFNGKVNAQEDGGFKTVWEGEFANRASVLAVIDAKGDYIFGSDDNEGTLLNAAGEKLWSSRYKDLSNKEGVNNSDYQFINWEANLLFLFDKKIGKDKITVIDVKGGKALWTTDEYQNVGIDNMEYIKEKDAFLFSLKSELVMVNARTGQKIWETTRFHGAIGSYLYVTQTNEIVMVNYKPSGLAALFSGFKNQLVRINAANGEVKWDVSFFGFVEREVITRKPLVKLILNGDKVFLQLDGLQVFDFETGATLWKAVYETDQDVRKGFFNRGPHGGKVIKGGIYGAIAEPVVSGDAVYLVLGGDKQKQKFIEKHDLKTGKLLWTSDKISNALALPAIHLEGGKLIAQIGGLVNKQTEETVVTSSPNGSTTTTYQTSEYVFIGSYGIVALDPATGKVAWKSEKFDKRISNLVFGNGLVFAGSGDEFYGFDVATGEMKINVDHSNGKVGKTMWAFDNGENITLVCDKGIAAYSKKDGTRIYISDKFKGVTNYHIVGDNFFLRRETDNSNTICSIDLKSGMLKGYVRSKGKGGGAVYGDGFDITADGEYIFVFKGKGIQKIKVNK